MMRGGKWNEMDYRGQNLDKISVKSVPKMGFACWRIHRYIAATHYSSSSGSIVA